MQIVLYRYVWTLSAGLLSFLTIKDSTRILLHPSTSNRRIRYKSRLSSCPLPLPSPFLLFFYRRNRRIRQVMRFLREKVKYRIFEHVLVLTAGLGSPVCRRTDTERAEQLGRLRSHSLSFVHPRHAVPPRSLLFADEPLSRLDSPWVRVYLDRPLSPLYRENSNNQGQTWPSKDLYEYSSKICFLKSSRIHSSTRNDTSPSVMYLTKSS